MKVIKKIFVWLLIIVFFAFAIGMSILLLNKNDYGVTEFEDVSLIIVKDEVNNEKYEKGDLVLVEKKRVKDISVGDEVFVYTVDTEGDVDIDIANVGSVYESDGAIAIESGVNYTEKFIVGEGTEVLSGLGTYLNILQSTWVFFFIIVVPCFLLFIYQIYALIVEIKYGDED